MKLKTPNSVIRAHDISQLRFRDTPFVKLMNKRIYNILMVASRYDMFILEDDGRVRSEEHTSELQSRPHLVCRLLLEKKNKQNQQLVSKFKKAPRHFNPHS